MQSSSKTVISGGGSVGGSLTSRSRSKKPSGKQNSWHELEILSKAELISKLYREFNGVSTLGSKISLMCRIRIYQSMEFVHAKRLDMEMAEMMQYKQWRLSNASHLGTNLDPEAEKYELPPPNFFTGAVSQISHDTLFAQTNEVLSTYIRDHFFGYPTGGKKELLVGRIRVLLRFPKDQVSDSQMREEEIYEAELVRNYLNRIRQEKEYEQEFKKRKQQILEEATPKQMLIKEAFAKHPLTKFESAEGKLGVSRNTDNKVCMSVGMNTEPQCAASASQSSTDNRVTRTHSSVNLTEKVEGAVDANNIVRIQTTDGSVGTPKNVPFESIGVSAAMSKSVSEKQQVNLADLSSAPMMRKQVGEDMDLVIEQKVGIAIGANHMMSSKTTGGSVGATNCVPFESISVNTTASTSTLTSVSEKQHRSPELGISSSVGNLMEEGDKQQEEPSETAKQHEHQRAGVIGQSMVEVNIDTSLESVDAPSCSHDARLNEVVRPMATEVATASVESDAVSSESLIVEEQLIDLSAKISGVLREIEKSAREAYSPMAKANAVEAGRSPESVCTADPQGCEGLWNQEKSEALVQEVEQSVENTSMGPCSTLCSDSGVADGQVIVDNSRVAVTGLLSDAPNCSQAESPKRSDGTKLVDEDDQGQVGRDKDGLMPRTTELCRLASMYASMSDEEDSVNEVFLQESDCVASRGLTFTPDSSVKLFATPRKGESASCGETNIPAPVVGMSVPSWDLLLRGRKAADVRGYVQKYFPHINVECSTPILAAKIRVLVGQLPITVTNEELDGLVRAEGEGYKDWYQMTVLGRSTASVSAMMVDSLEMSAQQQLSGVNFSRSPMGRFASWADTSSDDENEPSGGTVDHEAQSTNKGGVDSADDKFMLAARLVLLGEADSKAMELTSTIQVVEELPVEAGPVDESMREIGNCQEKGAVLELPKGCAPIDIPVESEWVGAAAYIEYSRLVLAQPDSDGGGRSRGLLLSSMTAAMRIVTGLKFSDGPCHKAILDNGFKVCKDGWSQRLIALASPSVGAAIRAEITHEMSQTVECVFEIYYRHFFFKPNMFHYRYGAVFAAMHEYQIQIWTVDLLGRYSHVVSYGDGQVVSRWLVRDLLATPSRIELLMETVLEGRVPVDVRLLIEKITKPYWDQVVSALELAGVDMGAVVEGCFISSTALLQLGRGGRVTEEVITVWGRICQRINAVMYIASSKEGKYIDSVWFLPPRFFNSILIQEDDVVLGYDVLRFPTLLTDIERLRAKILLAPYCPYNGHWGAGLLHVHEHDVGYIEHGEGFSSHPSTPIFLQAFREWFNCQYAMKYDVLCTETDAVAWTTSRGVGVDSLSSDGYDNSVQLMLEMFLLSTGMKKPLEITRTQLERFRWYVVVVMSMSTFRRDRWIQDLSHDICGKDTLQEIVVNVSVERGLQASKLVNAWDEECESTHSFDFRSESEKRMLHHAGCQMGKQTSLTCFPRRMLLEIATVLTEKFTYAEMWLIEHVRAYKVCALTMLASAGTALGAVDFSIAKLAELLEADIFVEMGDGAVDTQLISRHVTLEWWLWANMCPRRIFVSMMSEIFPDMSLISTKKLWRRADIAKSEFTLATTTSMAEMKGKAPVMGFLCDTFPSIMGILTRDLEELSEGDHHWQMNAVFDTSIFNSLVVSGAGKESCSLRMREAGSRLQMFMDLMTTYQLEGRLRTSRPAVKMSSWRMMRHPDSLVAQFDLSAFEKWWKESVICDLRLSSFTLVMRPLAILLTLEKLELESKLDYDVQLDLKHAYLLRSLNLKMKTSTEPLATKVGMTLDQVIDLLLAQRTEEAKVEWVVAPLSGGEAVGLCKLFFSRLVIEGRWEDSAVYVAQVPTPTDQVVVIGASSRGSITVGFPDKSLVPVMQAQNRQVMHAAFLYSNYGISIDVTLGKYWSMSRGIRLTWLDEGEISDEVASKKDLLRGALVRGMGEKKPLWLVLGLAPTLDMMVRLSYMDGASFSQAEITSVRCRDSLRTLLASEKASVISFSQATSDYPLGIVGSYGRRTLESMSKDPSSVVSMLVKVAQEGRSLDVFTVDHYSTPAEYSTKTLRSMFSVLQWLSEHNIISTQTTIEFKNVRSSEMTEAFYNLLGKDFITSRISMDCSPWVEMSMRYAEWLRRREVKVSCDTVANQFRDSVPGQEVLRLKWQGHKIPKLPIQDTDITESQLSVLGVSRFGEAEADGGVTFEVPVNCHIWLFGEVQAMCRGSVGVELLPYTGGKAGKKQLITRVYPVAVVEEFARHPEGVFPFRELLGCVERCIRHRVVIPLGSKDYADLCSCLAAKLGFRIDSFADMSKLVQVMLEKTGTVVKASWKWRALVETSLSSLQLTLDKSAAGHDSQRPTVWQQYGNLGLLEKGAEPISADEFAEQLMLVESLVAAMLNQSKRVRIAFCVDTEIVVYRDELTIQDAQDLQGSMLCIVGIQGEGTVFQFVEVGADTVRTVVRGMQEIAHTLTEAMVTKSSWKAHSLFWYHRDWQIRLHWVHLALKEVAPAEFCGTPWAERSSRGRQESVRRQKRARSLGDSKISKKVERAQVTSMYESCKAGTQVQRLCFAESVVTDRVVVSGFHASCVVSEVARQIVVALKLIQISVDDSQVQATVIQGGCESSSGLKMYVISLKKKTTFSTRADNGSQYFFSILSDLLQVKYGQTTRQERFLIMVSPCPPWLTDIRQPAFVSRGFSGVDSTDMSGVDALGWILRHRFPSEVGDLAFVRVQIRVGFSVSNPGSLSSTLLRYANETVVLHFSANGVRQLSVWSWLERQEHWTVNPIHIPKQGKSSCVLLRDSGSKYDLWKSCKQIIGSGFEHILASADLVGPRPVTILSCRNSAPLTEASLLKLLELWESQSVDLSVIASVGWVLSKLENIKGRKKVHNRPSHLSILWAGDSPRDVPMSIPEFRGLQFDMEVLECLEGMWRSSIVFEGSFISLLPGNIRNYFVTQGQTVLPRKNKIITALLSSGWGHTGDRVSGSWGPLRSALKRSVSYADITGGEGSLGREEESATSQESGLSADVREEAKSTVSTLSSTAGDDKVWQELSKLQAEITTLQRPSEVSPLEQAFEDRMRQVENATKLLQMQQEQTTETLAEVQRDGLKVAQAVDRIEGRLTDTAGCIRDIRDMLQRQNQMLPPAWMNPTVMLEVYRTQLQAHSGAQPGGLLIQEGQRLHGATTGDGAGAGRGGSDG